MLAGAWKGPRQRPTAASDKHKLLATCADLVESSPDRKFEVKQEVHQFLVRLHLYTVLSVRTTGTSASHTSCALYRLTQGVPDCLY